MQNLPIATDGARSSRKLGRSVWEPRNILQLGYVCRSLESAVDYFIDRQGAGPFYLYEVPPDAVQYTYRGKGVTPTRNRVAFGYRGPLQFELIETDNPLFDHVREDKAIAYHHCMQMSMQMTADFGRDCARYAAAGHATMGTARMSGVLIHYIDTRSFLGHHTELFDYQVAMDETGGYMFKLFELMHRDSLFWDGSGRLRPMPEPTA